MRRFILAIIVLIFSVWLGLKIAHDPGLVLLTYSDWSVEMPLWFGLLALIAFMFVIYFLVRFFDEIDTSFYRWKNWLRWRRKNKAYSKTNRGLIELIEGHWASAENFLLEGIDQSDAPLINYLALARAAHERGAYDKRDMYLRQAHDLSPQADIAIGLTQAQLQFNQGQLEQALATLNHLRTLAPSHQLVLKLLQKLYVRLGDWKGLLKLLPSLRKAKLLTAEQYDQLELRVYQELLNASASKSHDINTLHEFWATVPRRLQKNPRLIAAYVKKLLAYQIALPEIEELIVKVSNKSWDSELIKVYGVLNTLDAKKQLTHAEKWLKLYPSQAVLFLTLGRLCMRNQLWGKARSYLEDSLKLEALPETFFEYGALLEHLGDTGQAVQNYRAGLSLER